MTTPPRPNWTGGGGGRQRRCYGRLGSTAPPRCGSRRLKRLPMPLCGSYRLNAWRRPRSSPGAVAIGRGAASIRLIVRAIRSSGGSTAGSASSNDSNRVVRAQPGLRGTGGHGSRARAMGGTVVQDQVDRPAVLNGEGLSIHASPAVRLSRPNPTPPEPPPFPRTRVDRRGHRNTTMVTTGTAPGSLIANGRRNGRQPCAAGSSPSPGEYPRCH